MSDVEQEIAEQMDEEPDTDTAPDDDEGDSVDEDGGGDAVAEAAPEARSQADIEQIQAKLESEATRHDNRVRQIMGDDFAMLVPSPIDWTPGYIFNVEGMRPFPEQLAQLDALLGRGAAAELLPAEDAQACEKCAALGEVLTGSKKDGQRTKPCSACNGTGWVTKFTPMVVPQHLSTGNVAEVAYSTQPNQFQVADRWGRPFGHPHYNLDPASVGV